VSVHAFSSWLMLVGLSEESFKAAPCMFSVSSVSLRLQSWLCDVLVSPLSWGFSSFSVVSKLVACWFSSEISDVSCTTLIDWVCDIKQAEIMIDRISVVAVIAKIIFFIYSLSPKFC